jgi:dienelactone hydrolase
MNILTNRIEYPVGDSTHQGYLAYDDEIAANRPGIVIVHEWWGLNDYIVRRAHMLAELGYVALAIDMYGGGRIADNPDQAGELMNGVLGDMNAGTAALRAGYDLLLDQPGVDPERTAAIGYCFGGAMVLQMARIGLPLSAVASFPRWCCRWPGLVCRYPRWRAFMARWGRFIPPHRAASMPGYWLATAPLIRW